MAWGVPQIDRDADIVVACLQDWPDCEGSALHPIMEQIPGPRTYCFEGCNFSITDIGGPGKVDIRVMDLARKDKKNVRWTDVEKMCVNRGIEAVPISYRGPGIKAPGELLDSAPYVVWRLVARGPWMCVRRPVRAGSLENPNEYIDLND